MKCGVCGEKLLKKRYSSGLYQRYKCRNECDFQDKLNWRIRKHIGEPILVIFFIIIVSLFILVHLILDGMDRVGINPAAR